MALPFFYNGEITGKEDALLLQDETSKHIVQVLRMTEGEKLQLTNGKGNLFTAQITETAKKKCTVRIIDSVFYPAPTCKVSIAISLLKNTSRFEWFLEKATEIGVQEIFPLSCTRTLKQHFRKDRLLHILESAMIQSQQVWLPSLHEPVKFSAFVSTQHDDKKLIAYCEEESMIPQLTSLLNVKDKSRVLLIGPEGDFTKEEINEAVKNNYQAVNLGKNRLRSETAGVVGATLLCNR